MMYCVVAVYPVIRNVLDACEVTISEFVAVVSPTTRVATVWACDAIPASIKANVKIKVFILVLVCVCVFFYR